jgi:AbrB family looped-hinge helix DNA binding protein
MVQTAKVTSKAQITIPKKVRDALNLHPGDLVQFEKSGAGAFTIRRKGVEGKAWGILANRLPERDGPVSLEEMDRAIAEMAAEKNARGSKRHKP